MTKKTQSTILIALVLVLAMYSCQKNNVKSNACELNFNSLVRIGQPQLISTPTPSNLTYDSSELATTGLVCEVTEYEWAPGYDEPLLLSPTSAIFPGAIMGAQSLTDGGYSIITGDRAPLTISTSFQNLSGSSSVTVPVASLSEVRNGIRSLLQGNVIGPTSANLSLSTSRVYNESSLRSALTVAVDVIPGSINSTFNWNSTEVKNRMIARFTQVYYTVDVDLPSSPRELWNDCPDNNVFRNQVPVIVSTVKYGRSAILSIESSSDIDSLETAVELALKRVDVNADFKYKQIIDNSSFNLTVLGGNAANAVSISDFDGLRDYVLNGANYSEDNPAEPLSYKMKFLDDYSDAYVILYSKFNVRNCQIAGVGQVTVPSGFTSMFNPSHNSGGDNFKNTSVKNNISAEIYVDPNNDSQLLIEVNWSLYQDRSWPTGDTEGSLVGWKEVIYTAPAGKKIASIDSDLRSDVVDYWAPQSYENNYQYVEPNFNVSNQELVDEFKIKVHTSYSNDFGTGAHKVNGFVYYNPIILSLEDI